MEYRPLRSVLYMPATNAKAIEKARGLACDAVILDLEDAVAPEAKEAARDAAVVAVRAGGFGRRLVVVRANALDGPWGAADCAALRAAGPDAVLVPKVDDAAGVARYRGALGAVPIWAMVETVRAVLGIGELAGAEGLAALVVGTNDLAKEMRARPDAARTPFQGFLAATVAAARAHGLAAIDGVCNAIEERAVFAAECAQGVMFGFDGKTLIHPAQIEACNAAFSPSADEVAWAREVVAAFDAPEAGGRGVIRVAGKMVERLHLDQARQVLAVAEAIGG